MKRKKQTDGGVFFERNEMKALAIGVGSDLYRYFSLVGLSSYYFSLFICLENFVLNGIANGSYG